MYTDVYYSNFWYSRFYKGPETDFSGNLVTNEIEHHARCLRLLAMFFEKIYIPRTHLLTFRTKLQSQINRSVFEHKDFGFLLEAGVIAVSSYPGIDAKQDNERIVGRKSGTERVIYPDEDGYLGLIPIDSEYKIDSLSEAEGNTVSFPEYADVLEMENPNLSRMFLDAIARSNTKELPFYHEEFLQRLHEKLPADDFIKVWKETNSIYLTSGAISDKCIAHFNEELESLNFRYRPMNFDRYLFSPATLYTFLRSMFSDTEIQKILYADIEEVHGYIRSGTSGSNRALRFRQDYQKFAKQLSIALRGTVAANTLDQLVMGHAIDAALHNRFRRMTTAVSGALNDLEKLSRLGDLDGSGIAARGGITVLNRGMGILQRVALSRRYPGFVHFSNMLKGHLKGVTVQ